VTKVAQEEEEEGKERAAAYTVYGNVRKFQKI
jgi:hypothetical protein